MEEIRKRDWSKSKYGPPIRLTKNNHEWVKEKKGKKTMAGFLDNIINKYKESYGKNKGS